MALLNMNDLIQNYAMQSGILNSQGQMAPPPQPSQQPQGILSSPGLSNALFALSSTLGQAAQQGYGVGPALAVGAGAFGNTLQAEKDKIRDAERKATQERLAALKDIVSLKAQQEELGLRMQAASLARRAQQDALDEKSRQRQAEEAQREAILSSGDPRLAQAMQMFGPDAAQQLYMDALKPKDRKIVAQGGVQYYADTGEPVLPNAPSDTKTTDTARKERSLAEEGLNALEDFKGALYDPDGSINRTAINLGELSSGGRDVLQPLRTAIANNIYLKTGAAATPGEISEQLKQYQSSRLDTQEQIERKYQSLQNFLQSKAPDYQPQGLAKKPDAQGGFKFLGVE